MTRNDKKHWTDERSSPCLPLPPQSINQSINQSRYQAINQSINQSIKQSNKQTNKQTNNQTINWKELSPDHHTGCFHKGSPFQSCLCHQQKNVDVVVLHFGVIARSMRHGGHIVLAGQT
jgi:hypothetical protein